MLPLYKKNKQVIEGFTNSLTTLKKTIDNIPTDKKLDEATGIQLKEQSEAAWNAFINIAISVGLSNDIKELGIDSLDKVQALEHEKFVDRLNRLVDRQQYAVWDNPRDDALKMNLDILSAGAASAKEFLDIAKRMEDAKPGSTTKTKIFGTVGAFLGGAIGAALGGVLGAGLGVIKGAIFLSVPIGAAGAIAGIVLGAQEGASYGYNIGIGLSGNELAVQKNQASEGLNRVIGAFKGIDQKIEMADVEKHLVKEQVASYSRPKNEF